MKHDPTKFPHMNVWKVIRTDKDHLSVEESKGIEGVLRACAKLLNSDLTPQQVEYLIRASLDLRDLAEEMAESICYICKVHNPQHKDCEHCADMDGYKERIAKATP